MDLYTNSGVVAYFHCLLCYPTEPAKIQSMNYPNYYFGTKHNFNVKLSKTSFLLNIVSPGLTEEEGTVSFQSPSQPNKYLRFYASVLYLEDRNGRNTHIFPKDATFRIREDIFYPGFVSFESVNYPGRFIRHVGCTLKLCDDDGTEAMHNDTSFKILVDNGKAKGQGLKA